MKRKKMIAGLAAALFCLVFVGAFLAQGYEREGSEFGFAVERNVPPSSNQLKPDANWEATAAQTSEDSLENLENAYYYQMNEDKYININDGQVEVASPLEGQLGRDKNHLFNGC